MEDALYWTLYVGFGFFGLASTVLGTYVIRKYMREQLRWKEESIPLATLAVAFVLFFLGGWLMFDLLFAANLLVRKVRRILQPDKRAPIKQP